MKLTFLPIALTAVALSGYSQLSIPTIFVYTYDESGCTISRQDPNSMADYMALVEESDTLQIKAFPQIAETKLYVLVSPMTDNSICDASIFSIEGDLVHQCKINHTKSEIDVSHLKSGIYVLNITANDEKKAFRFIKQ